MKENNKPKKNPATCVKFSESEFKKVQISSKLSGRSIPALLKEAFFKGGIVKPKFNDDDAKELLKQLNRIGNNINQIARHLNFGISQVWETDFETVKKDLLELRKFISERDTKDAVCFS